MNNRHECPVCHKEFWVNNNYNLSRKNLTCSPECRERQRTIRQRERRFEKRMARLAAKAARQAAGKSSRKPAKRIQKPRAKSRRLLRAKRDRLKEAA